MLSFILIICSLIILGIQSEASIHDVCTSTSPETMAQSSVDTCSNKEVLDEKKQDEASTRTRQPAIYVNHGGGPMPYLQLLSTKNDQNNNNKAEKIDSSSDQSFILESCSVMGQLIKEYKPSAILVISAHWEAVKPSIIYKEKPDLLYDYYGFPQESYNLTFNAKCDMKLSLYLSQLLKENGFIDVGMFKNRGWDHGVFIPFLCNNIIEIDDLPPLMQLSLLKSLNAEAHIKLGTIIASLRNDYNVMIVGSGMSIHNLRVSRNQKKEKMSKSKIFKDWLTNSVLNPKLSLKERISSLIEWDNEKKYKNEAKFAHPRQEHLLPLHVVFGSSFVPSEYQLIMKQEKTKEEEIKVQQMTKQLKTQVFQGTSFDTYITTGVFF